MAFYALLWICTTCQGQPNKKEEDIQDVALPVWPFDSAHCCDCVALILVYARKPTLNSR